MINKFWLYCIIKKPLIISCALAILLSSFSEVLIHIDYHINLESIVKNLCENRFTPAKKCNGKCYLKKKLKENDDQEERAPAKKNMALKLTYLLPNSTLIDLSASINKKGKKVFGEHSSLHSSDWKFKLLRPPTVG